MSVVIELTPTWVDLLPLLVEVAVNGATREARKEAMGQLMRLAKTVDEMNEKSKSAAASVKEGSAQNPLPATGSL